MLDIEAIWRYAFSALIASVGGLAQIAMKKDKRLFRPFLLFCELFSSAVCGCLVLPLANIIGLSGDWVVLFGFAAGLSSPWVAKKVTGLFKKQVNASMGGPDGEGRQKTAGAKK